MTFSTEVKDNLSRVVTAKSCCNKAELAGFLRAAGTVQIGAGGLLGLSISTSGNQLARRYYKLLKEQYNVQAKLSTYRSSKLQKRLVYSVKVAPQREVNAIFAYLAGVPDGNPWQLTAPAAPVITAECCKRAYLRGAYLGSGSVNNPEGDYHLELVCQDLMQVEFLVNLLAPFGIYAKTTQRKKQQVLYLKGSEAIVDFLNVIGAHTALLEFENVRILKEMRNAVNRQMNCESANLDKMVNTGLRQVAAVRTLMEHGQLDKLPPSLQETALLRLEYPDVSLKELGEMLTPTVGKSGINHRLRKLEEYADKLCPQALQKN